MRQRIQIFDFYDPVQAPGDYLEMIFKSFKLVPSIFFPRGNYPSKFINISWFRSKTVSLPVYLLFLSWSSADPFQHNTSNPSTLSKVYESTSIVNHLSMANRLKPQLDYFPLQPPTKTIIEFKSPTLNRIFLYPGRGLCFQCSGGAVADTLISIVWASVAIHCSNFKCYHYRNLQKPNPVKHELLTMFHPITCETFKKHLHLLAFRGITLLRIPLWYIIPFSGPLPLPPTPPADPVPVTTDPLCITCTCWCCPLASRCLARLTCWPPTLNCWWW